LSICIPTYNRAELIKETLDSIIRELEEGVEVVVCDNGSSDHTEKVVDSYRSKIPHLLFFRFPENQGVDRCFLKSIAIAKGAYCWLMGSDDRLEPGGVHRILHILNTVPDLAGISVNVKPYDALFQKALIVRKSPPFPNDCLIEKFSLFFPSLYLYAGYLSGQVVKRELWQDIVSTKPVSQFFNCYSLVYIITSMFERKTRWFYIHTPCVGYRADNDSFLDRGAFRRLVIDIKGFSDILKAWFQPKDILYKKTMDALAQVDITWRLLRARTSGAEKQFWKNSWFLCWQHYAHRPVFWHRLVLFFILPSFFWKGLRFLYRQTIKSEPRP
jgi:abequosyltransferase